MDILQDKDVVTRKEHQCFACLRTFPKGTKMNVRVVVDDYIGRLYSCDTCKKLMKLEPDALGDVYDGFQEGCVAEVVAEDDSFKTPEDYLEEAFAIKEQKDDAEKAGQ